MPRYHATIIGHDVDAMADLVRKYKVTVARHTLKRLKNGNISVDAHVEAKTIRRLATAGYTVRPRENVDQQGKERQIEFRRSAIARQAARRAGRSALRAAQGYLGVDEVEAALSSMAMSPNTAFTHLIDLPHRTWEGRACHALRIGKGNSADRRGIYLLGGVHAREWGSPDILINFARLLTQAYQDKTSVTLGSNKFSAAAIRKVVEHKDVLILPQVNPDGRHHSMSSAPMWRKNRRPAPPAHANPQCVGVDLNRNFDFMWNYPHYFDADAPIANSTD